MLPSLQRVLSQPTNFLSGISTKLSGELIDHKLLDNHGLESEGRTEKSNPNFANHPKDEIAKIENTTSTSRPLCLTASSRYLSETMDSFNQLNFKTGHNKPLRRTSASSWSGPVTAGRSAARHHGHFKEAKPSPSG